MLSGWGRLEATALWRRAFRRVEAGADAGDVAPAVSARATAGDPALMPQNEETLAAVPGWPAVARCERAGAPARDDRFWVRWPVGPPLPACVPAFDDGVEGAGCAGLLLIGVVVAGVPAGGGDEALVGAEEPLPDEALVSAGVAVGEDEDDEDEDEDEDDPFEEAGVPPELVLPLALPVPEPQPVWWPLSGEPESWL